MLRASQEVLRLANSLRDQRRVAELQGDAQADLRDAWREAAAALHRAQHGPALMVGTETGAQDGAVRHDAIASLLRCEFTVAEAFEEAWATRIEQLDADCDGLPEITARTPRLRATILAGKGGSLIGLDIWSIPGSLMNLWSRLPEPWHPTLPTESGSPVPYDKIDLDDLPIDSQATGPQGVLPDSFPLPPIATPPPLADLLLSRPVPLDTYIRACFLDRFLDTATTFEMFRSGSFAEAGDFVNGEYRAVRVQNSEPGVLDRGGPGVTVELVRDGNVNEGAAMRLARVAKKYRFPSQESEVLVDYTVANTFHDPIRGRFAVELNLNLDSNTGPGVSLEFEAPESEDESVPRVPVRQVSMHAWGETEVSKISWVDQERGLKVVIKVSPGAHLWHFPVETISPTPRGLDRLFQGFCLLLWWPIELWSLEERSFQVDVCLES